MCIERQGVEKEGSQSEPPKVIGRDRHKRRKYDPIGSDALAFSFAAQIRNRVAIGASQPQDAVLHGTEQPQPNREDLRTVFVTVIEARKYKSERRQAGFRP